MMNNMMMNNINPMGMNNMVMNPIGIINQSNLMNNIPMLDETAQNIKSIIEPYENKIRELEEIIKQKDFEITVLKQKLKTINNNSNNNFMNVNPMNMNLIINMNPMNMNPNPINIPNSNNNQPLIYKGTKINLKVRNKDNILKIECFEGDLAYTLKTKCNFGNKAYTYKYKPLNLKVSFKDNGVYDNALIDYKTSMKNIVFRDQNGTMNSVVLSYDCPLGIAICYYIIEYLELSYLMSEINREDRISFIYNGKSLKINDKTPIGTVFDSI